MTEPSENEPQLPASESAVDSVKHDTKKAGTLETEKNDDVDTLSHSESHVQLKPKKNNGLLVAIFLIVLMVSVAGIGYGYYLINQFHNQLRLDVMSLSKAIDTQQKSYENNRSQLSSVNKSIVEELAETKTRLGNAEQRLTTQNKRLLSLSTTSREDWLLAEAEYLLKLANQRVLIERSAIGAEALLVEADGILRDMNDPDLFPLRQAIADDLTKLRLTSLVDVEGIYLELGSLSSNVERLPLHPSRQQLMAAEKDVSVEYVNKDKESSYLSRLLTHFEQLYVIRERTEEVTLLSPDNEQYLRHNLILILERSKLALLREQQKIYNDSLAQIEFWVEKYYPVSNETTQFKNRIAQIKNKKIVQTLPDITPSLELLNSHIERLHLLKGDKK